MSILILSYAVDPHVDAVKASIQAKGKQFVEYCFLQYPLHSQMGLELKDGTFRAFLTLDSKAYNTEEFTAIRYRRPMGFKAASTVRPDVREYIENESKALFNNMACLFPNALLVSDPVRMRLAENKLFQLQTACRVGLQIPHTFMETILHLRNRL